MPVDRYRAAAEVSGFTRGLDLARNLALVRLSLVRESAMFNQ